MKIPGKKNKNTSLIPYENKIFVNRSMNFGHIKFVGFDMDYTLAIYYRDTFEDLAFKETLKKFIEAGYPSELETLCYKPHFLKRGLLVDKELGNVLKVDGHKYVKIAYHGHKPLTKEERHKHYNAQSFKAQNFLSIDSFFALSEVQLFVEIVEFMSNHPGRIQKSFQEVYHDLRIFMDTSHQDGSIKHKVMKNLEHYILKDKLLPQTLFKLLESGKSLFLLTNSHYEFTATVLDYLLSNEISELKNWKDFWDITIVGASKPKFFVEDAPFLEVDQKTLETKLHSGPFNPYSVYQGGNAKLLETLTGYRGDEILYVGDHIFGDIMRSKHFLNWRTLLVVEELAEELSVLKKHKTLLKTIADLLKKKELLDEKMQRYGLKVSKLEKKLSEYLKDTKKYLEISALKELEEKKSQTYKQQLLETNQQIKECVKRRESLIHPIWGELMKVGLERSRYATQVALHACLYTAKVSNMRNYSPYKKFLSIHDVMPHDTQITLT